MQNPLRILHLEDQPLDAELIQARLTADGVAHATTWVSSRAAFETALLQGGYDMILADENLPGFDGQAALALAKALCPDVPFIFVSGALSEDQAIEMLKQGATDYVFKVRLGRLAPVVQRALLETQLQAERRQAEIRLRRHAERQAQLAEASHSFAMAATQYQHVLEVVCRTVHQLTGDACTIRLRSEDGQWLEHVVTYHPNPEAQALQAELKAAPLPIMEIIAGQPVRAGEALLLPQVNLDQLRPLVPERLWPLLERFPIYSVVAVPLRVRGQALGALIVTRGVPGQPFGEDDRDFLASLADHAALAIDNARTIEAEQAARQAMQLAVERIGRLQAVTAALTSPRTAREVAEVVTRQGISTLEGSASSIYLLEYGGEWLGLAASVGMPEAVRQAVARIAVAGDLPAAEVFRSQSPQWLSSNDEFIRRYPSLASTRSVTRNEALVILPLSVPGQPIGILSVSFAQAREFTADDQAFLLALANVAAQAAERARLYDAEQQALAATRAAQARIEFMAATSMALVESLDYEATLQTLAHQMVPFLADWCLVDLLGTDGQLLQVAVAHAEPVRELLIRRLRGTYPPAAEAAHPILQVIHTRKPILAPVVSQEELAARAKNAEHLSWLEALDIRSHIVVPLVARGQAIGALSLVRTSASPAYAAADLALAEEVARRAAQAIDNARLYGEAQSLNAFLERRVGERTSALADALKMARGANEDLEREVVERRQAELRFRHLLENAPDATVIVDAAGQILLDNSQTERLFGYRPEALLGQPVERLIPERFWEQHQTHRQGYAAQPHPRPMGAGLELYGRRQDGSEFPIEVSLGPLQSEAGLLISCAVRDITRRKQVADQLRASRDQLQDLMSRLQSVREEERASLAREIHDELGQQLSGFKMDIAWLRKRLAPDQPVLADKLQSMANIVDTTIKIVRQIATALRPGLLDDFGIIAAIEWQLRDFQERSGIITRLKTTHDDLPLPRDTATALFRVFQESLTNIARHAQATEVDVKVEAAEGGLVLEIKDNGQGFEPGSVDQKRSLGLAGMRERVQAFNGTLTIASAPKGGTTIRVQMVLPAAAQPPT